MTKKIKTNIEALDRVTGGLGKGELILVGGRPCMGKTMFALHMMHVMAVQQKAKSILFSYAPEYDLKYMNRLHTISKEESELFSISKLTDIDSIKSECQKAKGALDIIFIDYFQIIDAADLPETERYFQILKGLKALAQDMNCPVVLLSQVSRDVENRDDHRPSLSDLPDLGPHGKTADYADVVCFLYRENYYKQKWEGIGIAELIISKYSVPGMTTIDLPFFMDFFKTPLDLDTSIESVNLRIKRLRGDVHLTQQELADRINVSSKTISKWESGRGLPEVSLLVPLCRALGVTVDYLLDCKI